MKKHAQVLIRMSRLCCHDNTDNERRAVMTTGQSARRKFKKSSKREMKDENKKPSTADLFQRIEELEFELECLWADHELQSVRTHCNDFCSYRPKSFWREEQGLRKGDREENRQLVVLSNFSIKLVVVVRA